jgi:hypothetical protein
VKSVGFLYNYNNCDNIINILIYIVKLNLSREYITGLYCIFSSVRSRYFFSIIATTQTPHVSRKSYLTFPIMFLLRFISLLMIGSVAKAVTKRSFSSMSRSIYEFSAKSLSGEEVSFSKYQGKPILIENIASL